MIDEQTLMYYFARTFDVLMVLAPNIGFIAQILKFRNIKSSKGFSILLTFTILTSSILRIFFWIGKRFALPLLLQSIMSIFMQLYLIHEFLKYSHGNPNAKKDVNLEEFKNNHADSLHIPVSILDIKNFWNWPHLIDYVYIIALFSLALGFISNIVGFDNMILVESFGIASACFEAIVGIPQIIQNCKNKNTESLSVLMIITWMVGDTFKTIYFVKTNSPLQLVCCGLFQMTIDSLIIMQILYYNCRNSTSVVEYKSISCKENSEIEVKSKKNFKGMQYSTSSSDTDSSGEELTNVV